MRFKQLFNEGYDEKEDKYIPTEEEKKKFGRMKSGLSSTKQKPVKKQNKPDLKFVIKSLTKIHKELSSDISRKKFYEMWYKCWSFDIDAPNDAIEYIETCLNKFNEKDQKTIKSKIEEIKNEL